MTTLTPQPATPPATAAATSPASDQRDRLQALADLAAACANCRRCGLAEGRRQVVLSRGNHAARLMLIGEAPGVQEDEEGFPFVGRSGRLLDQLLAAAGLDRQGDVYICNVVKCRPPGNRRPTTVELAACRPWLEQQIALVDPALIVLLGATALEGVLGIRGGITRRRGQWHASEAEVLRGRRLMPVLHPSYLLRFNSQAEGSPRALTAADLREVRSALVPLEAG